MTDEQWLEKPGAFSLLLNTLPFLLVAAGVGLCLSIVSSPIQRMLVFVAWLYLVPPVVGRIAIMAFGMPRGSFMQDQRAYKVWWLLIQLQTIFNRFPFLEEVLRLVPGLYQAWIALWGGRMSLLSYASPGSTIVDRHAVRIGKGAVLGFKSNVVSHMVTRDNSGRFVVLAEVATVEREAILGGGSGIGPGAIVRSGHVLPAGKRLAPFAEWPRRNRVEDEHQ